MIFIVHSIEIGLLLILHQPALPGPVGIGRLSKKSRQCLARSMIPLRNFEPPSTAVRLGPSEAVPHLLPHKKAWIDYDEEADVLYISLKRPQKATDTKLLAEKGISLHYRAKELVGVTVLDASKPRRGSKRRG
jgi:uncharacterized protein YuzE